MLQKELRRVPDKRACRQLLPRLRTTFIFAKVKIKMDRTLTHSSQKRERPNPMIRIRSFLAGIGGFEPPKCQSQSLVPYRLAISQYLMLMYSITFFYTCQYLFLFNFYFFHFCLFYARLLLKIY